MDGSSTANVQLRRVSISSNDRGIAQLLQGMRMVLGGMRLPAALSGGQTVAWAVCAMLAAVAGSAMLAILLRR